MRASGSHDVEYRECFVPAELVIERGDWGDEPDVTSVLATIGNVGLVGAFLGIAEAAHDRAVHLALTRNRVPHGRVADRPAIQHLMAEMDVDLLAGRASLAFVTAIIDDVIYAGPADAVTGDLLRRVSHQFQCAKLLINQSLAAEELVQAIIDEVNAFSGGARSDDVTVVALRGL